MVNTKQLVSGLGALVAGATDYIIYRPWTTEDKWLPLTYPLHWLDEHVFNGNLESTLHQIPNYFGQFEGNLPNFLGTAGAILVTKAFYDEDGNFSETAGVPIVYILSEVGQKAGLVPGTYDPNDIIAYLSGTLVAYGISKLTDKKETLEFRAASPVP
jgi:hypothetical protein